MIVFAPTRDGGRRLTGDTPFGRFDLTWSADGELIRQTMQPREPTPKRPPLPIPADHDPQREAARARQGGCCGAPTE